MSEKEINQLIIDTLKPYGVNTISLFGSYARKEQNADSDIDVLVDFKNPFGLFTLIKIESTLSKALNKKVDLITTRALNSKLKPLIEKDLQVIYK